MTHTQILRIVIQEVDRYDSDGLLASGCPADEYDPEIEDITANIEQHMGIKLAMPIPSVTELWFIVCNVLHRYFGKASEPVLYWQKHKDLARAIHRRLRVGD